MRKKRLILIIVVIIFATTAVSSTILLAGNENIKEWKTYTSYKVNEKVSYSGNIYYCIQAHTSLPGWQPTLTPALWGLITNENSLNNTGCTKTEVPRTVVSDNNNLIKTPEEINNTPEVDNNSSININKIFAPYIDVCLYPPFDMIDCYNKTGQKFYTLAFITANGSGNPAWGGIIPLENNHYKSQIDEIRKEDGDVIVSFGGAAGNELALVNNSVDELANKYQSVIDKYDLNWVDFDIEGAAVANRNSVDIRNKAIKILQKNNKNLKIAFCLPVLPSGLTNDGLYIIQNAKENALRIDIVNVMAMDYGDWAAPNPDGKMGQYAIDSAENTLRQINQIGVNAKIGITPMIGQNDVHSEVFYLNDAKNLLNLTNSNSNIELLSMWSATRDNGKGGINGTANATYSGIEQGEFDFINIFKNFN